jgi:hypothetical protein
MVGPTFGGGFRGFIGMEVWRNMQNRGPFGGPTGVEIFLTKPLNFRVDVPCKASC